MTTAEFLLARKLGNGSGGDVTIESLNVTENGTYSEQGKAYSPVVVNFPLDEKTITANGEYLASADELEGYSKVTVNVAGFTKKAMPTGAIASFNDGTANPLTKLKVAINPVQDLHGYDSPWAGGSGKNKINAPDITLNSGGYIFNGKIDIKAGTYTMSWNSEISSLSFAILDGEGNSLVSGGHSNPYTFTLSADAKSAKFYSAGAGTFKNIMIESGSTATTFAPYSNICPISGWTGVNIYRTGANVWGGEKLADDIVAIVPNATKNATNKTVTYSASQVSNRVLFTNFKENTQYTFYMSTESPFTNLRVWYSDGTNAILSPNTVFVSQNGKTVDSITGLYASGDITLKYEECGVFEGVITAQDFEPYVGTTYPISWQTEAGEVFGGELDVTSGVLKSSYKLINAKDMTWTLYAPTNACYSNIADTDDSVTEEYPNGKRPVWCTIATYKTSEAMTDNECQWGGVTNNKNLNIKNSYTTSLSDWENYINENDVYIAYPVATPTTYQLTPTQVSSILGNNNIWADTGDILEGEYFKEL